MKLFIILATYNGAKYIEEQIKSIQDQTVEDWSLLIRDDGSKDDTVDRIKRLENTDHRIKLINDESGNLGVVQNFARLMQIALDEEADYVAIADQDDVWHRDKLKILLGEIADNATASTQPILIHSDLEVVDENRHLISRSFMEYTGISPLSLNIGNLLCQNSVTGCTCLINRALLKLTLPVPHDVPMHDWWLTLLALTCGKVVFIQQPLVQYRQHSGNVVSAQSGFAKLLNISLNPKKWRQQIVGVRTSINQASLLLERLRIEGFALPIDGQQKAIKEYAQLTNASCFQRWNILSANGIQKRTFIADMIYKIIILSLRSNKVNLKN